MSTETTNEIQTDLQTVCDAIYQKKAIDSKLADRIRARAEKVREEFRRKNGLVNVGVDLIREARDAE